MCATSGHILLVEDDMALRTMLRGMLEIHDFTVSEAERREDALAALNARPGISVVVLDLGLPPNIHDTSEGIATLKSILAEFMAMKVIVLTGQDQKDAALAAIREGAFDFLGKPAPADSILQSVRRAMLFAQKELELSMQGITRIALNTKIADGIKGVRADAEEKLVRQVLKESGFNVYQSAKRLGIKRENIYYFMKKFGIERDD